MQRVIFDIETDNLLDNVTKIHCLSYMILDGNNKIQTITDYTDMCNFFRSDYKFVGHNIACYDLPVVRKVLGISANVTFEDTLFLSQYVFPNRKSYSLESFGEDVGVEKIKIDDWSNLTTEQYIERCERDVEINMRLFYLIANKLMRLYSGNTQEITSVIGYIGLKAFFAGSQISNKVHIDRDSILDLIAVLGAEREKKIIILKKEMPKVPKYSVRNKPKITHRADGALSKVGEAWFSTLKEMGLPEDHSDSIKIVSGYSEPNPLSVMQVKDWLFSLGWKPSTLKFIRDKETNELSKVPQIYKEDKSLCESVSILMDKNPAVSDLNGLGILNHRIEQLEGLLKYSSDDNYIRQELFALTPTFRFRHGKVVNLPSVDKAYGKEVRSLFTAPSGFKVVGCDIKALEDQCKLHYIQPIDPDYVAEISKPGYDPHLALAVAAGFLTQEQADAHKKGEADYSKQRKLGKVCNFSSQYSVGAPTLARNTGLSEYDAKKLLDAYWRKNWAIKRFSSECEIKKVDGENWVKSPLTGFFMHLRNEKDIFSVVTQSAGVYVFDNFVAQCVAHGIKIPMQVHDEIMFYCEMGKEEEIKNILRKCIDSVNKKLKMNVIIDIDIKFGNNYAEVH